MECRVKAMPSPSDAERSNKAMLFSYKIPDEWVGLLQSAAESHGLEFDAGSPERRRGRSDVR